MRYYPFTLTVPLVAGDTRFMDVAGTFVRYDEETTGAAANRITFTTDTGEEFELKPGQAFSSQRQFSRIALVNKAGVSSLAGTLAIGTGLITDSNITGSVVVTNQTASCTDTPTAKQVTNASQVLAAANVARKKLEIQNQDLALNLFLRTNGIAATADNNSIKVPPGETYRPYPVPTGEIRGIMDGATAANNVNVIEG